MKTKVYSLSASNLSPAQSAGVSRVSDIDSGECRATAKAGDRSDDQVGERARPRARDLSPGVERAG